MPEEELPGGLVVKAGDVTKLSQLLNSKNITCEQAIEMLERYTSPDISVEDKKVLIAFFDDKMRRAGIMKGLYKKILTDSIGFLDELPVAAKRWSVNAYINFLKELDAKGLIKKLGER
jgi:hypothetical protein